MYSPRNEECKLRDCAYPRPSREQAFSATVEVVDVNGE
jgi:hypothetical protein